MPRRPRLSRRLSTAARWPVGVGLTSWRYMWRTTPVHRRDLRGSPGEAGHPALPDGVSWEEARWHSDGAGPLFHRRYTVRIAGPDLSAAEVVDRIGEDMDRVAPSEFATFEKVRGEEGALRLGDEYTVRMPAPWDGPVRVVAREAACFRFVTLEGHLEAGQIEFRARDEDREVVFTIESWARSGDRLSNLLFHRLRMAKEVQLHMWCSTLERIAELAGGRMRG